MLIKLIPSDDVDFLRPRADFRSEAQKRKIRRCKEQQEEKRMARLIEALGEEEAEKILLEMKGNRVYNPRPILPAGFAITAADVHCHDPNKSRKREDYIEKRLHLTVAPHSRVTEINGFQYREKERVFVKTFPQHPDYALMPALQIISELVDRDSLWMLPETWIGFKWNLPQLEKFIWQEIGKIERRKFRFRPLPLPKWIDADYCNRRFDSDREAVNYIRHKLTEYDFLLQRGGEDPKLIKARILDRIAIAYPFLTEECKQQREANGLQSEI